MKQQFEVKLKTVAKCEAKATVIVYADSQEEANQKALRQARAEAAPFVVDALNAEIDYEGSKVHNELTLEECDVLPDLYS
jgi:hypothetical protein